MPFQSHVELLQFFLGRRREIVERIQGLLNARRQPDAYLQDRSLLAPDFEDCFFTLAGVSPTQSRLRAQLEDAHSASGFRPREGPGLHNGLVDPAEMMVRGFHFWQQTRWPGRSGRVRYAHALFDLFVVRCLALLSMRLWDAGPGPPADRLSQVQDVLDRLWAGAPAGQPVFVRDARWLIPLAQSPITDDLGAYFEVAERVAETLPEDVRLEIHRAGVRMAGGHLRSQLRHLSTKRGVAFDDDRLVLDTRTANALDFALQIEELVPLLAAYESACLEDTPRRRLDLAGAICQGVSPDPELFLDRVDLLAAYSMIEHLFVTTDDGGQAVCTPMGRRHLRLVREYGARLGRVATPLSEDCPRFRPVAGACSPYGVLYGFSSDLVGHMALKALQPEAVTRFSVEDVFVDGDPSGDKLAWVRGWRDLPHVPRDVVALFDYPQQFAEDVFDRVERALRRRAGGGADARRAGRLFVGSSDDPEAESRTAQIPALPLRYIASSDASLVAARRAEAAEQSRLLSDRREGRCLLSYRSSGGWVAISKAVLTEVLGAGQDAKLVGLPPEAAGVLMLMSPDLVVRTSG